MEILVLVGVGVLVLIGALLLQRQRPPRQQTPPSPPQASDSASDSASSDGVGAGLVQIAERPQPLATQQRRQMLRYLKSAYNKGSEARLAAMEEMVAWGHPSCLPLLRRGLRDADLRVVGLAARGLERFRGPRQRLRHPPRRPRRARGARPSPLV